jgi:hypothetical protein
MSSTYIIHENSPYDVRIFPKAYKTFKEATDALEVRVKQMKYLDGYAEEISSTVDELWKQTLADARVEDNVTQLYIEKGIHLEIHHLESNLDFEILVFENHDLYDSDIATQENVVKKFVDMCYTYVNPWDAEERYTHLRSTDKSITYCDRSGNDKSKLVQLIGHVSGKLYDEIRAEIKKLYVSHCEDCGVQVPMNRGLCLECANK